MKKFLFTILTTISLLALTACTQTQTATKTTEQQLCFTNNKCIDVEIAQTNEERKTGLMFRESLPENSGMLFVYPEKTTLTFWMKNTLIPLDMIWLNDTEIVHIETATPCESENDNDCERYLSPTPANYVLEVNAGFAEKNNIKVGDSITSLPTTTK